MRWFPLLLVLLFGISACALKAPQSEGDGPEVLDVESEEIHSVDPTPPPIDTPSDSRPSGPIGDSDLVFGDETRLERIERLSGATAERSAARKTSQPAWQPPPEPEGVQAPMAGRVGIMSLLGNELRHVHSGTTPFGNHEQDYNVQYDFGGYVMEELRQALLTRTPYQPVAVAATGALRRDASTWMETWDGEKFAETFQREFDGIISQNRLSMLIIVAYPTVSDGVFGTRQKLRGSGLYTRSFFGDTEAAVFSTMQFYRIAGKPAQLVQPVSAPSDRNIGDLPNAQLPDDLEDLPPRYLGPIYQPLRLIVQNKLAGLVALPRKLGY
ncbi:hypothetical protein [Panacagrimonas sp.]|uniref:hypothetical protein n=1 Tax=Panacagrimonas sp. TaxID=2480088 RepID=UPI003B5174F0